MLLLDLIDFCHVGLLDLEEPPVKELPTAPVPTHPLA
jgi:hypothetical protein